MGFLIRLAIERTTYVFFCFQETAKSNVSESKLTKIETRVTFEKQSSVKNTEKIGERVTENVFHYYFLIFLTIIIYVCIIILPFIVIRICYYRRCISQKSQNIVILE